MAVCFGCAPAHATTGPFVSVPPLYFSTTYTQDITLSQVITITNTGDPASFKAAVSTNSGGSWLSLIPASYGFGQPTPYNITVVVKPTITTAAGTYTGQIVVSATGLTDLTIPVTMVVHAATETYFDQVAGGLSFSMLTSGNTPPAQDVQIRSANTKSLAWTATTSTGDGNNWLNISSASGTAPSKLSVSVNPANLPDSGSTTGGTFTGQVLLTNSGSTDTVSIPITFTVGADAFAQVNPLSFAKTFDGPNPLSQEITIASTGAPISFIASVQNATGGNWLTITPATYGFGQPTPYNITVGVNPAVTLAAGTYVAEIIVEEVSPNNAQGLVIPVTMTVNAAGVNYFDNVAGAVNFSIATKGNAPPAQDIFIRDAGPGTLPWTATVTTADGGNWLTVSKTSDTAPSQVTVSVDPASIPGNAITAGTFVGQIVLAGASSRITVPVSFTVADAAFQQVNPINFTKVLGGPNPLSQVITIASTGASLTFIAKVVSSNGLSTTGAPWLSITPATFGFGQATPYAVEVSVNPAVTLTAGTYTAEIVVYTQGSIPYAQAMTIPVTLTIQPAGGTIFDDLPGEISFFMATGGTAPPAQVLPIRNAGQGTLDWTATLTTTDGGNWLTISNESGTAPSEPTVSVNPLNIPFGGLQAGTFTGLISLEENGQEISVPVSFTVGASVFEQVNPLSFTMTQGGANPLPQIFTVANTGTTGLSFTASVVSSNGLSTTGAPWLSITPATYGYGDPTPLPITASVTAPVGLAAGTYSAEILVVTQGSIPYAQSFSVPVTLIVQPKTATFFDSLPGQLTFSMLTKGGTPASNPPPSQPIEIRNAGAGTLNWTATVTTSDGGSWLSISSGSGTAPSVPQVSVDPTKVLNSGLVAGVFTGQIVLETAGDRVTVPVTFTIGANVYRQVNSLNFNMVAQGANPLPQLISITTTGSTSISTIATPFTSTGGNWLQITPSAYGYGHATTLQMVVSVNTAVTLAAGTYTGEIVVSQYPPAIESMVIPVTLTVNAANSTWFADMQGGATFSALTGTTTNPPTQSIPIRNAGTGTLHWNATASTSDGGNWLTLGSTSGTAPDSLIIGVNVANLPNSALIAGQFSGQVMLTSGTGRQSIPVAMVLGANNFVPSLSPPAAGLTFTRAYATANPGFKVLTVSSTGTNFTFVGQANSATGGNWLGILSPANFGYGVSTPLGVELLASPAITLPPGTYIGETIFTSTDTTMGLVYPVTLSIYAVPAATPKFSPAAGTYTTPESVTITTTTPAATIYYTTDGKAPTNASTKYTGPVKVTKTMTIKAVAYATYYLPSAIASGSYVIGAAKPVIKPAGGTSTKIESVTITDSTPGAVIYYTTTGAAPSSASTKYTKPILVNKTETIEAIAYATGYNKSAIAIAKFTVKLPALTPTFSKPSSKYPAAISVTITDKTVGAVIYYSTNGKAPTTASTKYTKPVVISQNTTLEAIAIAPGGSPSPVASAAYIISTASPVFTPKSGAITSGSTVTITDATPKAVIYYTTNGTVPTTASKKYTAPIAVTAAETIKAVAIAPNYGISGVTSAAYTVK